MTSLAPEVLFSIGKFPITNTVIDTLLVDAIILGLVLYIHKKHSVIPTFFQTLIELAMEQFFSSSVHIQWQGMTASGSLSM